MLNRKINSFLWSFQYVYTFRSSDACALIINWKTVGNKAKYIFSSRQFFIVLDFWNFKSLFHFKWILTLSFCHVHVHFQEHTRVSYLLIFISEPLNSEVYARTACVSHVRNSRGPDLHDSSISLKESLDTSLFNLSNSQCSIASQEIERRMLEINFGSPYNNLNK
jgi:hypothetical protein